jgi:hypothetical protein
MLSTLSHLPTECLAVSDSVTSIASPRATHRFDGRCALTQRVSWT